MTSKLIPADPNSVMVIRQLTPNITTCSAPFWRFGRFSIGGRGTIVRLQTGALAVFSPTALTPEVRATVESMGNKVSYIAALDIEHHIYITDWAKAFPDAAVLGPDGLPEKRAKDPATKDTKFKYIWTNSNKASYKVSEEFDSDFDYEYVGAHGNKELVFFYKPERTLIQADLMFALPATEQFSKTKENPTKGLYNKLFNSLMTASGSAIWQKRFIWYAASSSNRADFNKSVARIDTWDFDRIIPCHGDVIESGGKGIFRKVFEWHLNAAGRKAQ